MSVRKNPSGSPARTSSGEIVGKHTGTSTKSSASLPPPDLETAATMPSALPKPRGTTGDRLLSVAIEAARAGGAVLVAGLNRPLQIENKSEKASIVTQVDLDSQAAVFSVIGRAFPEHMILGEEGDGGGTDASYTWLVDPLDGTSNYAHGIPFSCVSVAVRDELGVVAGAVFEPFRGELFTAVRGGGAWLDGQRLSVTDTPAIARALICTGLQSDDPGHIAAHGRRVVALHTYSRGARMLGSPALCLAYVAAGRIDAFFERNATYAWDVGAGSLLITEAGGACEDLDGGPLNFGHGIANVIGTNGKLHKELADLIATTDGTR
jgi:myo-inositol-1(or 4)-monophosphatase